LEALGVSNVKISVRSILVYLTIAFVLVAIWNNPTATGQAVGDFFGALGSWLLDLLNKLATFVQSLFNKSST
jgi:hypothetical protein